MTSGGLVTEELTGSALLYSQGKNKSIFLQLYMVDLRLNVVWVDLRPRAELSPHRF